jgi:hypothetical protein
MKRKTADVRILRLPRITPDGKSGLDDVLAKLGPDALQAMLDAAPSFSGAAQHMGPEPTVRSLHDVESKLPTYIWDKRLARGELTMFSGDPGTSKTFLMLSIAADLSRGRLPVTGERCQPMCTLFCSTENSAEHVTAPRFRAMGGDDRRLFLFESPMTLADVTPLDQAIVKYKADLLVLDPLQSYFGEGADSHKATEVRPRMDALMRLAVRHNIAVAIVRHLSKAAGGRAIHRGMGSIDFSAAVRIEFMVGNRVTNPNDRALITVKNNLGQYAPALGFLIEGDEGKGKLRWTGETDMKLADLTAPEAVDKQAKTKVAQCEGYLRALLMRGPLKTADVVDEGVYDARTINRAAERIGVIRTGSKKESGVVMSLPKFARGYASNSAKSAEEGKC